MSEDIIIETTAEGFGSFARLAALVTASTFGPSLRPRASRELLRKPYKPRHTHKVATRERKQHRIKGAR